MSNFTLVTRNKDLQYIVIFGWVEEIFLEKELFLVKDGKYFEIKSWTCKISVVFDMGKYGNNPQNKFDLLFFIPDINIIGDFDRFCEKEFIMESIQK